MKQNVHKLFLSHFRDSLICMSNSSVFVWAESRLTPL